MPRMTVDVMASDVSKVMSYAPTVDSASFSPRNVVIGSCITIAQDRDERY